MVKTGRARRPAAGRVALLGGPAPAMDPFPVPGRSSVFVFLQVDYHCWDSRSAACVLCVSPGDAHALCHRIVTL